jgi:hypothetical protein
MFLLAATSTQYSIKVGKSFCTWLVLHPTPYICLTLSVGCVVKLILFSADLVGIFVVFIDRVFDGLVKGKIILPLIFEVFFRPLCFGVVAKQFNPFSVHLVFSATFPLAVRSDK